MGELDAVFATHARVFGMSLETAECLNEVTRIVAERATLETEIATLREWLEVFAD